MPFSVPDRASVNLRGQSKELTVSALSVFCSDPFGFVHGLTVSRGSLTKWLDVCSDRSDNTIVSNPLRQRASRVFLSFYFACLLAPGCLPAATFPPGFKQTLVSTGVGSPTAMAFAPDGRLFICQQNGRVRIVKGGTLLPTPFAALSVNSSGERGLLGLTFDPGFTTNGYLYLFHTTSTSPLHNQVVRLKAEGDSSVPGSSTVLLELNNVGTATSENGGGLQFGTDGKLYIGAGDTSVRSNGQSLATLQGKLLRINPDGTIPADNPFFQALSGNFRAIWARGLRNPFTLAVAPTSGRIFINDVGDRTWEEINEGKPGANYGWATAEGPSTNADFIPPVFAYRHGTGPELGRAITGGVFYDAASPQYPAEYRDNYFFADYGGGWIRRLDTARSNAVSGFATNVPSPIDLDIGPEGALYYLSVGGGAVYKIEYTLAPPRLTATPDADGLRVAWGLSATGFVLQSTESLFPPIAWEAVKPPPVVTNGEQRVLIGPTNERAFFRLTR